MILDDIVSCSHRRVSSLPDSFPSSTHVPISLREAILQARNNAVIAELKFASPSRGIIREKQQPADISEDMILGGCCALSILTEPDFFHGCPDTIPAIRNSVNVPILRKDFIVNEHQLDETKSLGADAVLLISSVLGNETGHFVKEAQKRGLEPLLEVHTRKEAKQAMDSGAEVVGINNRDLRTFRTDLSTTKNIAPMLKDAGLTVVSASGMVWPCDIRSLHRYADGFLIGSSIMSSNNPRKRVEGFVYA
ncbi:indole-3-glycerol-phosphate synthase [Methanospirillum stamsii]|uniref:indole-3-glycerol-phosphate synthase n=1 Tax=Methanospirillum stamsii TaxID=1277351 RepID=A0A2V2N173_9EURY|nr:indole-3-glycerol-phosphate synthase [Methanospirillum stamsii]PWR72390.1 indole-3-glycerol phosphate synthase [Methanospirillum stamsii]